MMCLVFEYLKLRERSIKFYEYAWSWNIDLFV